MPQFHLKYISTFFAEQLKMEDEKKNCNHEAIPLQDMKEKDSKSESGK